MLLDSINDLSQVSRELISERVCKCFAPSIGKQCFYIYVGKDTLHHRAPVLYAAKNLMFLIVFALFVLLYSLAWELGSFLFSKRLSGLLDSLFDY